MEKVRIEAKNGSYDIIIGEAIAFGLGEYIEKYARSLVVTDDIVYGLYKKLLGNYDVFVINSGEQSKCHENLLKIYDKMAELKLTRQDALVAFGGGVVGDLAGFAAATFKRGVRFAQIPTTLLAQVDSSVGGKVGVNLPSGKNMVGAFYQPDIVLADTLLLKTLDKRQVSAGMAEIIKYAFIADNALYETLKAGETDMPSVIKRCCCIKAEYVRRDPFDTGVRMQLNFGHTVGHAIEAASGYSRYLHGEGVAMGMVYAAEIGEKLGVSPRGLADRVRELNEKYALPSETDEETLKKALESVMLDKKAEGNTVDFILIDKIGHALAQKLSGEEIKELLL